MVKVCYGKLSGEINIREIPVVNVDSDNATHFVLLMVCHEGRPEEYLELILVDYSKSKSTFTVWSKHMV